MFDLRYSLAADRSAKDIVRGAESKYKYECSMCEYRTSQKQSFGRHRLTHSDLRMYECPECPYRARTKDHLQKHARTHANRSRRRFECEMCGERFARSGFLLGHLKRAHSVSVYGCDKCAFETTNARYLVRHRATHEDAKPYRCDACGRRFKLEKTLLEHVRNLHNEKRDKFKCPKCAFETIYPGSVKKHLLAVHSGVERFKCPRCAFRTCYKATLERHLHFHEDAKPIECESCAMEFWSTKLLARHEKQVHAIADKSYTCGKCEFRTRRKGDFKKHLMADGCSKFFACTLCPYKTNVNQNLKRHIATHNDAKPFKCAVCPQTFKEKSSLTKHARNIHSKAGQSEYKCSQCPFGTNYKTTFVHHVNAHNKSELFRCSKCDYNTHHKGTFKKHRNSHGRTTKRVCRVCSFRTNDECEFDEHMRKHELVKPFQYDGRSKNMDDIDEIHAENKTFDVQERPKSLDCPACGTTFNYKGNLARHIKRLHASEVKEEKPLSEAD